MTLFVDSVLYLALVPFLPHYAERFDLSKAEAGLVLAALPAAILVSALPVGVLAGRLGSRRVVIAGNIVFTAATIAFAFAPNLEVFVLARIAQGVANATCWGASLAWLTANAPADRRGAAVGSAMGLVAAGSIAGPALGALGGATSPEFAFSLVAVLGAAATALSLFAPAGRIEIALPAARRGIIAVLRHPLVIAGLAVSGMDAFGAAILNLLGPLQLGASGYSETGIALPILVGAAAGWVVARPAGRLTDRVGPLRVAVAGGLALLTLPVIAAVALSDAVIICTLIAIGPLFSVLSTTVYPFCSAGADQVGVPHGIANGAMNLAWAGGAMLGQVLGGALAERYGDEGAYMLGAGAICLLLVVTIGTGSRRSLALEP